MIWRCPKCRGTLIEEKGGVRCEDCAASYKSIDGILDLRLSGPNCSDDEIDRARALRLLKESAAFTMEEFVYHIYASHFGLNEKLARARTRRIMEATPRLRKEIKEWLRPCVSGSSLFLDLGCGPGMLLAAAAAEGRSGIGIDRSMVWLVVARRLIAEWGGKPLLAAGLAESLPLADNSISSVISLDVIEHVNDRVRMLREIDRVTQVGGRVAFSTPHRYSLAAEPHVSIWGVGWLPRPLQKRYVKWRTGRNYDSTQLLSTRQTIQLLRQHTRFKFDLLVPPVPEEEIFHFPRYRAALARLYNRLASLSWTRWAFLGIGPFFRVVGVRQ